MFLGSPNGFFKLQPYRSPPQCIIQVAINRTEGRTKSRNFAQSTSAVVQKVSQHSIRPRDVGLARFACRFSGLRTKPETRAAHPVDKAGIPGQGRGPGEATDGKRRFLNGTLHSECTRLRLLPLRAGPASIVFPFGRSPGFFLGKAANPLFPGSRALISAFSSALAAGPSRGAAVRG